MVTRISGLASGMDIDSMVQSLMKAERMPLDSLNQKKTALEWKKAAYNDIYNAIQDFRNNVVFNNKLQSTLSPQQVLSSDATVVTAKAVGDAANINHTIKVYQLADGAKSTSSQAITTGTSKDTLAEQFTGLTGSFDLTLTNGSQSKVITVDTSKSIYELVSNINNAGVNIKASYDATLDRFFLSTTNTGSGAEIDFTGSSANGLNFLQNNLKISTATVTGQDAEFALDGVGVNDAPGDVNYHTDHIKQSVNTFSISGVTYTLKKADPTGVNPVNVTVSPDIDTAVENVKAFIDAYNSTLDKINSKLNEAKYSDYLPLTDDQKKEMKDSEITAWEDKAKSGLLSRDSTLTSLVNEMRNDLSNPITGLTGTYNSASSIGITTGFYQEGGKLYLDENKLRDALQKDPDVVRKIFGQDGASRSEDGIAVRLYDSLKTYGDRIANVAGKTATSYDSSVLGKLNTDYYNQIQAMQKRLTDVEDRYYAKFTTMEEALNKMNSQSAWLSQQFASN